MTCALSPSRLAAFRTAIKWIHVLDIYLVPMRGGMLVLATVIAGALAGGCGDEAPPPTSEDGAAEAADVVNVYLAALKEADGEAACPFLTQLGQQAAVKVFEGQGDPSYPDVESLDAADCPKGDSGYPSRDRFFFGQAGRRRDRSGWVDG